jgi:hydrocephalus-inducing protein
MRPDGTEDRSGVYTIVPSSGVVPPGGSTTILVKFSPVEVDSVARLLVADIPLLDAAAPPLQRHLDGHVLRPWCHFELPESDYISRGRRRPDLPGPDGTMKPLDPATKVVEMESLGVRVLNTKRFYVLNPTGIGYDFTWAPVNPEATSPFTCLTRKGTVSAGRRFEMVFEYVPTADNVSEAFWTFRIPDQGIEVHFVLVGHVAEPRVTFDRPAVTFGQVLVGGKLSQKVFLINNEALPFEFKLDRASYEATSEQKALMGGSAAVEFEPSEGVVPPNGKVLLLATFKPLEETTYNYSLQCAVKNKPTQLSLTVKGEGYALHESLQIEGAEGQSVELAPRAPNPLEYGQVIIHERLVKSITILNYGSVPFNYVWDAGHNARISVSPPSGSVAAGSRVVVELAFHPLRPERLERYPVTCQIVNGPRYTLMLSGEGHRPRLDLSFYEKDFGPVFVSSAGGIPAASAALVVRNGDTRDVSLHCLFQNTESFQVHAPATVLRPGQTSELTVSFTPNELRGYEAVLPFEVNGLYNVNVAVRGEGVPLRLEVANPAHKVFNLGAVARGQGATRVLPIVNKGRAPALVDLGPLAEALRAHHVELLPAAPFVMKPREVAEITFFHRPPKRVRPWRVEATVSVSGAPVHLATITGSCLGTELRLASDNLPFGTVCLGSRTMKRLRLENTGDLGTRFTFDAAALGREFSIHPDEGFLAPGKDVKLDVTFHPPAVDPDIRKDRVVCSVEGGADLHLTLTGTCVETHAQPEALVFECSVRGSAERTITLSNPTVSPWQLRPMLQNDFWTGSEFVSVPANGSAAYKLTFRPLTMSTPEQPHEGSVFFPIPDGTGLLYRLEGRSERPVPEAKTKTSVPAKTSHTLRLAVHNWLNKPQRFRVTTERKDGAGANVRLEGNQMIDVPALSAKDYALLYYSYVTVRRAARLLLLGPSPGPRARLAAGRTCSRAPPPPPLPLRRHRRRRRRRRRRSCALGRLIPTFLPRTHHTRTPTTNQNPRRTPAGRHRVQGHLHQRGQRGVHVLRVPRGRDGGAAAGHAVAGGGGALAGAVARVHPQPAGRGRHAERGGDGQAGAGGGQRRAAAQGDLRGGGQVPAAAGGRARGDAAAEQRPAGRVRVRAQAAGAGHDARALHRLLRAAGRPRDAGLPLHALAGREGGVRLLLRLGRGRRV